MRYTEYHAGKAVIKDRKLLPVAMEKLAAYENTRLIPEQVKKLKERDAAKDPEEFDGYWYKCPTCGKYAGGLKGNFCHVCGQRLKWED